MELKCLNYQCLKLLLNKLDSRHMKNLLWTIVLFLFLITQISSCSKENTRDYSLTSTSTPAEAGTVTPESGNYDAGEVLSLAAVPEEGWVFVRWEQDLSTIANPMNVTMNKDYNVVAVFEKKRFSLNLTIEGEGSVDEEVIQQVSSDDPHDAFLELTAVPDGGWEFVGWSGDLYGTDNPATITMNSRKSVEAIFEVYGNWPRDTETEVVEVTNPETGRVWMDRNLGASRAATSSTDEEAYGDLYQWGRAADGHQKRNSGMTSTLSSSDQPGHGDFISSSPGANWDWRSPQNDNLWQGVNGVNNPCPSGYRLPTEAEWEAERQSWSRNDANGAISSSLKLPLPGNRYRSSGSLDDVGPVGYYWSGTVGGTFARYLYFNSSSADMRSFVRAQGYSVRCSKD